MKNKKILGRLIVTLAMSVISAYPVCAAESVIPEGVYVGDLDLGGLTESEATQLIEGEVAQISNQKITLDVEGNKVVTTAKELGVQVDTKSVVDQAKNHIATGNLIQQYMNQKDLQKTPVHIPMKLTVDEVMIEDFVLENTVGLTQEPENATIERIDGVFVVTPDIDGKVVDIVATKEEIDIAIAAGLGEPVEVAAVITLKDADIQAEYLETIQDELGSYTTNYSSSSYARSQNLSNGAAKINGSVVFPGETLSGYECLQPFTLENGYYSAGAYENGQVVDSIGGGVCQIATTLYNAALLAEIEITQRQNHSMAVSYVKPSMDAAIAGTYKDIKITNNYSTPIYVEGYTENKNITFTIYGAETRPENREIKYVSQTTGTTSPGDPTETLDLSLAPGTRSLVQSSHTGITSKLWKYVYIDGVETEKTVVSSDTYMASKAIYLVGPAVTVEPEVEVVAPVEPQETEPQIEVQPAGPGVVVSPQPSTDTSVGPAVESTGTIIVPVGPGA